MFEFLIREAQAQGAAPQGGGGTSLLIMMVVFFAIFYFMIIRPQSKQAKDHKKMLEGLGKGDEVVTSGGLLGRVSKIGDHFVTIEIAAEVEIKVQKSAISTVLPKGTMKNS